MAVPILEVRGRDVILRVQGREIRFPVPWGRKLAVWVREGRSRNVVCNGDPRRHNLLGVTKEERGFVLTFLEEGRPEALVLGPDDLTLLLRPLEALGPL